GSPNVGASAERQQDQSSLHVLSPRARNTHTRDAASRGGDGQCLSSLRMPLGQTLSHGRKLAPGPARPFAAPEQARRGSHLRRPHGLADQEAKTSVKALSPGLPFSIARIARLPSSYRMG